MGICVVRLTKNLKIKYDTHLAYNIYTLLCAVKFRNMKLTEEVKIIFKNSEGQKEEMTITVDKLLESTKDE